MLYIGIIFILLGLYCIVGDIIDTKVLIKERIIVRKEECTFDDYFLIKAIVGVFAIIVGILSIVNYLMY